MHDLRPLKDRFVQALAQDLPYFKRAMGPPRGTRSAVLVPIGVDPIRGPCVLITRRSKIVKSHAGQFAFPGGVSDPGDRDEISTALRETHEEVGLTPDRFEIVGAMPPLFTLSTEFWITPVLALLNPSNPLLHPLRPSAHEIESTHWIALRDLAQPTFLKMETIRVKNTELQSPSFYLPELKDHQKIWGATAAILKNLIDRLKMIESDERSS